MHISFHLLMTKALHWTIVLGLITAKVMIRILKIFNLVRACIWAISEWGTPGWKVSEVVEQPSQQMLISAQLRQLHWSRMIPAGTWGSKWGWQQDCTATAAAAAAASTAGYNSPSASHAASCLDAKSSPQCPELQQSFPAKFPTAAKLSSWRQVLRIEFWVTIDAVLMDEWQRKT